MKLSQPREMEEVVRGFNKQFMSSYLSLESTTMTLLIDYMNFHQKIFNLYPALLQSEKVPITSFLYLCPLGKHPLSKTDEFSEKFQTAFDPPPHFRKIMLRICSEIHDRSTLYNGKNLQHKFLDRK